jgi:hypothetical protein
MGNCCPREAALLDDSREAELAAAAPAPVKVRAVSPPGAPAEHVAISLLDDSGEDDRTAPASEVFSTGAICAASRGTWR